MIGAWHVRPGISINFVDASVTPNRHFRSTFI
jgi:hypothetical protein